MPEQKEDRRLLSDIVGDIVASGIAFTDIHVESGMPVMLRQSGYEWVPAKINGNEVVVEHTLITGFLNAVFTGTERTPMSNERCAWKETLHQKGSLHPAVNLSKLAGEGGDLVSYRMRCTVQKQMMGEAIGLVLRPVPEVPESLRILGLPVQVERMVKASHRGLIIVTGPTGSGKSTTMAAMVGELNRTRSGNIITIEDPVECVHERDKCIINQREIGVDVNSFADGVRDALRFVPDVILIGEIRDAETMRQAVRATESGHLVLASMHAPSSVSAIRKMLAYLSDAQGDMQSLAYLLVGVVAQALVRDKAGTGKNHLASEFLDCRDDRVMKAIIESSMGDASYRSLATLEKQLVSGEVRDCALPMVDSLKRLIENGQIDAAAAASIVTTNEEKDIILKLARK